MVGFPQIIWHELFNAPLGLFEGVFTYYRTSERIANGKVQTKAVFETLNVVKT